MIVELKPLDKLIASIASFTAPNVFNPWRDSDEMDFVPATAAACRRERLRQHFDCQPELLLIGEAPGYQGCRFAGVAFTNESLLLDGYVPRVPVAARITTRAKPWCEPSATIVWGKLHEMGVADRVVMWNAFAWHPHNPGEPYSNRKPTKAELLKGAAVLRDVLAHFHGARIVAVGNVARDSLRAAYVTQFATVRHPSMGGANDFRKQMDAFD